MGHRLGQCTRASNGASVRVVARIFTILTLRGSGCRVATTAETEHDKENIVTVLSAAALNLRHGGVDGVHSIDFSGDRNPRFWLTLKMKGVKTNSFFDSF